MRRLVHLTLFVLFAPVFALAADRYWVGPLIPPPFPSDWNNTANWSTTLGGAGGASVPGTADVAIFTSTANTPYLLYFTNDISVQTIRVTRNFPPGNIQVPNVTFAGNVTLSANTSLQVLAGNVTVGGTLTSAGDVIVGTAGSGNPTATLSVTGNTTFNNTGRSTAVNSVGAGQINFSDLTVNTGASNVIFGSSPAGRYNVNGNLLLQSGAINSTGTGGNKGMLYLYGNLTAVAGARASDINLNFLGTEDQTITLGTGSQNILNGNIELNLTDPATLTLGSPVVLDQAGQVLTFVTGVVNTTAANYLGFAGTANWTGASSLSYVDGPVRKTGTTAFTFPVGDNGVYAPIHISGGGGATPATQFTNALNNINGAAPTYEGQYVASSPLPTFPNTVPPVSSGLPVAVSNQEYWTLRYVGTAPYRDPQDDANAPFIWLSFEDQRSGGLTEPSSIGVVNWKTNTWDVLGGSNATTTAPDGLTYTRATAAAYTVADNNPVFTIGTTNHIANPLPVTWLDFTGRYANGTTLLNWTTSIEKDNAEFTVERSADSHDFTAIGTVAGKGTSNLTNYYNFTDGAPLNGDSYYRIKQTDFDGKFSYSKTIRVSVNGNSTAGVRLFPNPLNASQQLTVENSSLKNKKVTVSIISAAGAIVRQEQATFGSDSRLRLNVTNLTKGSYFLRVQYNDQKDIKAFIVQ
ncbi:T9SS type A sorting domain-containing protein [Flavihumibacter petaseus]|nr:T9SS type A sorting domain-containing protein [Flavihumibacter petaseus]